MTAGDLAGTKRTGLGRWGKHSRYYKGLNKHKQSSERKRGSSSPLAASVWGLTVVSKGEGVTTFMHGGRGGGKQTAQIISVEGFLKRRVFFLLKHGASQAQQAYRDLVVYIVICSTILDTPSGNQQE